jgi:hypothetical protein
MWSDSSGPGAYSLSSVGCLMPTVRDTPYTGNAARPWKGSGMDEEVQRVFDALAGLADIDDPKTRALAVAKVLKEWPGHSKALREVRRQAVLELLAPDDASVRKIAKELGVSPTTVQDIAGGYSGSGKNRDKPKKEPGRGTEQDVNAE